MKRYPAHLPANHPDRLAADESIDIMLGSIADRLADKLDASDRLARVSVDNQIALLAALDAMDYNAIPLLLRDTYVRCLQDIEESLMDDAARSLRLGD